VATISRVQTDAIQIAGQLEAQLESASSSDLNSSDTSDSSMRAKAKNREKRPEEPTKDHLKIRAVVDAGAKWEL
jgi:hypothetical protein